MITIGDKCKLNFQPGSNNFVDFTQNLIKYVDIVKEVTGLEIGLSIYAEIFQDYYDNPKVPCKRILKTNYLLLLVIN